MKLYLSVTRKGDFFAIIGIAWDITGVIDWEIIIWSFENLNRGFCLTEILPRNELTDPHTKIRALDFAYHGNLANPDFKC